MRKNAREILDISGAKKHTDRNYNDHKHLIHGILNHYQKDNVSRT